MAAEEGAVVSKMLPPAALEPFSTGIFLLLRSDQDGERAAIIDAPS